MPPVANIPVLPPGRPLWEPPQPGFRVTAMHRATIFVRDLEKSLKLYRDILGMTIFFDNSWNNDGINAIMATQGETLRAVVLEGSEGFYGKLGIYQLSAESVVKALPPDQSATTKVGDFSVVFVTDQIDDIAMKLKAAGYPVLSEPSSFWHRSDYEIQAKEMLFRDPDGVLVNLVQPGLPKKQTLQSVHPVSEELAAENRQGRVPGPTLLVDER